MTRTATILVLLAVGMILVTATNLQSAAAQAPSPEPEPEDAETMTEKTEPIPEETTVAGTVPDWFKGVAGFWVDDKISTAEFLDGIEFLISEGVISVPSTSAQQVDETEIDDLWAAIGALQDETAENAGAIASIDGTGGAKGPKGDSCSVEQTDSGALIECDDGTTAEIKHGKSGEADFSKLETYLVYSVSKEVPGESANGIKIECEEGDIPLSHGTYSWPSQPPQESPIMDRNNDLTPKDSITRDRTLTGWDYNIVESPTAPSLEVWLNCLDITPSHVDPSEVESGIEPKIEPKVSLP